MSGRPELFRQALHQLCLNYGLRATGTLHLDDGEPGFRGAIGSVMLPPPPDDDDAARVSIPPLPSLRGWDKDTERPRS